MVFGYNVLKETGGVDFRSCFPITKTYPSVKKIRIQNDFNQCTIKKYIHFQVNNNQTCST